MCYDVTNCTSNVYFAEILLKEGFQTTFNDHFKVEDGVGNTLRNMEYFYYFSNSDFKFGV